MTARPTPLSGAEMIARMRALFPLCRSLTGDGTRATLDILGDYLPDLQRHSIASGTPVFDWQVPKEWRIRDAYIEHESGQRFACFADSNLHVVNYSAPVDTWLSREDLLAHIHTLPDQPDAVPYVTSYYRERWGFCLSENAKQALPEGRYRAFVDSELFDGQLDYADLVLPGEETREIFFSTYVCHPSMANNELSGPVLASALAAYIAARPQPRRHTYRFVFVPETIGALCYLSRHLETLKQHMAAGFVLSCVGDERAFSHVRSRLGDSLADKALTAALVGRENVRTYSYLERGSDERQYCAPGIDLPVCGFCRSKYDTFPEYHTNQDNFDLVTDAGMAGALDVLIDLVEAFEAPQAPRVNVLGEPQLGRRGLYATISHKSGFADVRQRLNVIAYLDGAHDPFDLVARTGLPLSTVLREIAILREHNLID